jgi:hypothetical protein
MEGDGFGSGILHPDQVRQRLAVLVDDLVEGVRVALDDRANHGEVGVDLVHQ